jgi:LPXTG-site transpeptidase (sortase) family protein
VVNIQPLSRPAPLWRRGQALRIASGFSLVVALALALGSSWRDGIPVDDYGLTGSVSSAASPTFVSGRGGDTGQQVMTVKSFLQPSGPTARPVEILIPALDVHRAVEKVGIDQSGVLNLPVNSWNAGWFEYGPVPGAPGDAVIEGHSGYPGKPLIFGSLYQLKRGDQIIVVLADRSRRLFIVVSKTTVPQGSAPAGLADPYGAPRLTLITCTGYFDKSAYTYTSRLVLEARYAGLA